MDTFRFLDASPGDENSPSREWCVAKSKAHAERQVVSVLEARQITTYLPLLKRQRSMEPLFPGYIFLNIDWQSDELLRCRSAPGVSYILSADGVPIPVTEELIQEIKNRLDRDNGSGAGSGLTAGDRVRITSRPFSGLEAAFDGNLTPHGRCHILLRILGRLVRVQIHAGCLKKLRT